MDDEEETVGHRRPSRSASRPKSLAGIEFVVGSALRTSPVLRGKRREDEKEAPELQVEQWAVVRFLEDEITQAEACCALPFAMIPLAAFLVMAIYRLTHDVVFSVTSAIEHDIAENANFAWSNNMGHKGINDVNSVADFWSWMRLGFMPLVLGPGQQWSYSEQLGDVAPHDFASQVWSPHLDPNVTVPVRGDYLQHSRIIGGIQMFQTRSRTKDCLVMDSYNFAYGNWWQKGCSQNVHPLYVPPQDFHAENNPTMEDMEWLLADEPGNTVLVDKLIDMETGCQQRSDEECLCTSCPRSGDVRRPWLDHETDRVKVRFLVFNPTYGMYVMLSCVFFFPRGGHIWKLMISQGVQMDAYGGSPFSSLAIMSALVLWVLVLAYKFVVEGWEILGIIKQKGARSLWKRYCNAWNLIDWISILGGIPVLVAIANVDSASRDVNQLTRDIVAGSHFSNVEMLNELYTAYDDAAWQCKLQRYFMTVYPIFNMLALFKSFNAQPRTALVTWTLAECATDVAHFGLVLFVIFLTFVVSGVCLFGQDLVYFANFGRAFQTTFVGLLGGLDWGDLEIVGQLPAGLYFWTFNILVIMLLLNMLLAIVMEAYGKVKDKNGEDAETFISQVREIYGRWKHVRKGEMVRLKDVVAAFEEAEVEEPMSEGENPAGDVPRLTRLNTAADVRHDIVRNSKRVVNKQVLEQIMKSVKLPDHQIIEILEGSLGVYHRSYPPQPEWSIAMDKVTAACAKARQVLVKMHARNTKCGQLATLMSCLDHLADLYKDEGIDNQQYEACRAVILRLLDVDCDHRVAVGLKKLVPGATISSLCDYLEC